jgi:dCMP deaminase
MRKRPNWDEYALLLAHTASLRSEDPWRQCGAAALRYDNSTAATGYNGTLPGLDLDWTNRPARQKFALHAERNALVYVKPSECRLLATTYLPCVECLKEIALKRIPRVVYQEEYELNGQDSQSETVHELAKLFKIELIKLPPFSSTEKVA